MTRWMGSCGLLLAVALISGCLGPLEAPAEAAGVALGLAAWARWASAASRDALPESSRRAVWLPALLGAPLVIRLPGPEARLACLALVALITPSPARACAAAFVGSALAWRILCEQIPGLWLVEVELSRLASSGLGALTGQSLDLGPSASGLDLLLLVLLHGLAGRLEGRGLGWGRAAAAVAATAAYATLLPTAAVAFSDLMARLHAHPGHEPTGSASGLQLIMFRSSYLLLGVLTALTFPGSGRRTRPLEVAWTRGCVAGAAALVLMTLSLATESHAGSRAEGDIVLLESPAIDMEVPTAGRHGIGQAGMFGMLPRYLALDGHRTRMAGRPLEEAALDGASVAVVTLPTQSLAPDERRAIESFVRRGASLLVLGDHTDLLGIQKPFNDLTGPWGIRLRFDSAYPAAREWSGCLDGPGHRRRQRTGIGTGASLHLSGSARPLVRARYALSDAGDYANAGPGAYLGDYAYEPGEQLGDLVLAAEARLGKGRVVAFGDTSSFQNVMLPFSYPFVAALMDDLVRPARPGEPWMGAAAGLAAAVLGLLVLRGSSAASAALAGAVLVLAVLPRPADGGEPLDRLPDGARVALVDESHANEYARQLWHEDSIGGLLVNLARDGYVPLLVDGGFESTRLRPSMLPVLLAPRRRVTEREARRLSEHLEEGGDLLVAASGPGGAAVAPLLAMYGVTLGSLPLGPVPVTSRMDRAQLEAARARPQFRRAWPVTTSGVVPSSVAYRALGHDVVVVVRGRSAGSGRLIVIGDADFLTDRVLEGERDAWPGNVDLLARMLAEGD